MKAIIKASVLLALALALAPWSLALAQAQQGLFGTVTAIDCAAGTITLETKAGAKEISITAEAQFRSPSGEGKCQDVKGGDRLALLVREQAGRLIAFKVMVVPARPVHSHTVGVISEVQGNAVTVLDREGQAHTIQWAPGLPAPQAGQVLAVVGRREADKTVAKGVKRAEEVTDKLQKDLKEVEARLARTEEELRQKGRDLEALKDRLEENASRHLSVLSQNLEKAPEAARKGLENALENASKGYQQALESVGKEAPTAKVEGVIQAVTPDSLTIALAGGRTITLKVTAKTKVEIQGASILAAGLWVEAKYDPVSLEASKIEAEAPKPVEVPRVTVEGAIERIGPTEWVIGGVAVLVPKKDVTITGRPEVGHWAEVTFLPQPDGSRVAVEIKVVGAKGGVAKDRVEFEGPIERVGPASWVIGGREVAVAKGTEVEGTPQVGAWAQVRAEVRPDGTLVALTIEVKAARQEAATFQGIIQKLEGGRWQVSGVTVVISKDTKVEGNPQVGARVEAKGAFQADGTFLAQAVTVAGEVGERGRMEFSGTLERMSADQWQVAGTRVQITDKTLIKGNPKIGDVVRVAAATLADGTVVAIEIEVEKRSSPGRGR